MNDELKNSVGEKIKRLLSEGWIAYPIPKELGGKGLSVFEWGQKLKLLGYENIDLSIPLLISLRSSVAYSLAQAGRPPWIERYVKPMLQGIRQGSFAYTERNDVFNLQTKLTKDGEHLRLNGEKLFVTGGENADVFLVYAKNPEGDVQVAVVDSDILGLKVIPIKGHGLYNAKFAKIEFDNVLISKDQLIENLDGISHAQQFLNSRRVLLVTGIVGRMQAVLESLIEYGQNTIRYGRNLINLPNYQASIGRLFGIHRSCEKLLSIGLTLQTEKVHDIYWDTDVSATKWSIAELAQVFAQESLRLSGGDGFKFDHPVAHFHRDAAGLIAGAGAQEVLEIDMGVRAVHIYQGGKKP